MTGDERTRFCAGCGLHVHNLSAMTRDEAERLVCERAGRLCVRYERTEAGGVRTLEYAPVRRGARGWRFWSIIGALGALAAAAAQGLGRRPGPAGTVVAGRAMMGDVAPIVLPAAPEPLGPAAPDGASDASVPLMGVVAVPEGEAPVPFGTVGPRQDG